MPQRRRQTTTTTETQSSTQRRTQRHTHKRRSSTHHRHRRHHGRIVVVAVSNEMCSVARFSKLLRLAAVGKFQHLFLENRAMCVKATVQPSGAAGAYKNKKQDKKSRCSFHCPMHAPDQTLHTVNLVFVGPLFLSKKYCCSGVARTGKRKQ